MDTYSKNRNQSISDALFICKKDLCSRSNFHFPSLYEIKTGLIDNVLPKKPR